MKTTDYKELLAKFDKSNIPQLYSDWHWLIDSQALNQPIIMSCFGDLFYKHQDGATYFLDTLEGQITQFASDETDMKSKLSDADNQNTYLSSENVQLLRERGLTLKENELYIYVPHPKLMGTVDFNSIQIMSMRVVISLNGQFLGQATAHEKPEF